MSAPAPVPVRPRAVRSRSARRSAVRPRLAAGLALLGAVAAPAAAQSLDDGLLLPRRTARVGVVQATDRWDHYWEGTRARTNENLGTVATRVTLLHAMYGLTDRVTLGATLPYVRTEATQGVLKGQQGWQDVTVAAKLRVVQARVAGRAALSALAVGAAGAPATDYTPDLLPMSIGLGARRASLRGAVHLADRSGVFVDASAGRAWRSTVRLDRPAYYTDGRLTLSDEVRMPDVADYAVGVGYQDARWCLPLMLVGQRTLGGGDIRRQDMPFVSNRMDFTRLAGTAMYTLPFAPAVQVQAGAARTLAGRNVGRATTLSAGVSLGARL